MPKGEAMQVLLGFGDATSQIRKNSRAEFVKTEPLHNRTHHVLKMTPQAADSPMRCYYLWVDAERSTISQLRLHPREGGEWMIRITHTRVAQYWLPSQVVITIKAEGTDPATLTFTFSNYRLNTGLSDEVFHRKS
jgi:outer membrane lipoprotein-sorting protein